MASMSLVLLTVTISTILSVACSEAPACLNSKLSMPSDVLEKHGKTYHLSRFQKRKYLQLNWTSAQSWCRKHGMELTSLETEQEQHFLRDKMRALFWTSGMHAEGDSWKNARSVQVINDTFTWTGTGEKVQLQVQGSFAPAKCIINGYSLLTWPCQEPRPFVCELEKC